MTRVNTNNTSLRFAIESSIGVLPGSPEWKISEFENIGAYGAQITTVTRRPISEDRGRSKGTVTDLDSTVEFDTDLTVSAFTDFVEGFVFAELANVEFDLTEPKLVGAALDVTATGYALGAALSTFTNGTLLAGKAQWVTLAQASLFFAQGYLIAGNNGLKPLTAELGAADVEVIVAGLAIETAPANALVELAGIRVTDGDLSFTFATGLLTSAADIADWATLGIQVGQEIHIGSADANGVLQNALSDAAEDDTFGYARVTAINANVLTLDKMGTSLLADANNTGDGVADVMFGTFARNVQVTSDADDNRFLERTYQFEVAYPDLGGVGVDEYEYAIGNFANEIALNFPLTDKATVNFGFIGTNADDVTAVRKTNAAAAISPLRTTAINTSSDLISLTTDVVSAVSDVCFKSLTLTILNNVSPEKCLGTLGARFVNSGLFEVNMEGQMLFTDKAIINAIKNNTTVTFQAIFRNDNGAICLDIPELTFGDGAREFPQDASVLVNISGASFTSNTFGYDLGISMFASVPFA
jgi:hypothetical protein